MDTNENKVQGRASYTEDERRELIEEFRSSGMTQAAFYREWNINPKTFARWLRIEREDCDVSFCEVDMGQTAAPESNVRVCLPHGVEIFVPAGSPQDLGDVFREAAACPWPSFGPQRLPETSL